MLKAVIAKSGRELGKLVAQAGEAGWGESRTGTVEERVWNGAFVTIRVTVVTVCNG
jgi:hypothetical protein